MLNRVAAALQHLLYQWPSRPRHRRNGKQGLGALVQRPRANQQHCWMMGQGKGIEVLDVLIFKEAEYHRPAEDGCGRMLYQGSIEKKEARRRSDITALVCSAEREGFEPSVRFAPYKRFPGVPVQPLLHLSGNVRWLLLAQPARMGRKYTAERFGNATFVGVILWIQVVYWIAARLGVASAKERAAVAASLLSPGLCLPFLVAPSAAYGRMRRRPLRPAW